MKGIIRWRGAKTNAAKIVNAAVGEVSTWVEPFAASLALYMMHPRKPRNVILGDIDCNLVNLWRCIRHGDFQEFERHTTGPISHCDLTAWSRRLLEGREALGEALRNDPVFHDMERAAKFWWVNHCMLGEVIRNTTTPGRDCWSGRPTEELFSDWARKVEGVVLMNTCWEASLTRARLGIKARKTGTTSDITAIIIDPPYEGFNIYGYPEVDHGALQKRAIELGRHPFARVVYFGYKVELPGWSRVPFKTNNNNRETSGMDGVYLSPHCLIGEQLELFGLEAT